MEGKIYEFSDYVLDVGQQSLRKGDTAISIPPKIFRVLTILVESNGQLVEHDELMQRAWPGVFVEETNLRYSIHQLRKTLEEELIETVPKRGYRFVADVRTYSAEEYSIKLRQAENGDELKLPLKFLDTAENGGQPYKEVPLPTEMPKAQTLAGRLLTVTGILLLISGVFVGGFYYLNQAARNSGDDDQRTIAVLPFTIVGETNDQTRARQFAIADGLIIQLRKIEGIETVPIDRLSEYFDSPFDPVEVGKTLGVDEILTGTFRPESEQTVLSIRAIAISDNRQIWAKDLKVDEKFFTQADHVFALPIARQVAVSVDRKAERDRIEKLEISRDAKEKYLAARDILIRNDFGRREEVASLFESVLAEAPELAVVNAAYADSLFLMNGTAADWEKIRTHANKAIELDGNIAQPHITLGVYHQVQWEWGKAEDSFKKAIELEPENANAYLEYGMMLNIQRRFGLAKEMFKKALDIEPFSPMINTWYCEHLFYDRRFLEAIEQCNRVRIIDPEYYYVEKKLVGLYTAMEMYDDLWRLQYGAYSEADLADDEMAKALKSKDMDSYWKIALKNHISNSKGRNPNPIGTAKIYAELRDREKTLENIKLATESPLNEPQYAYPDPVFDFVRNDPEFIEIMAKIGLNPSN